MRTAPAFVIYLLYGEDEFSLYEHLRSIKAKLGSNELVDTNTTTFDGTTVTLQQLADASSVVPFLAEHRLIIVQGFFARFSPQREQRHSSRRNRGRAQVMEEWSGLADMLIQVPATTVLVFTDGPLRRENPLLQQVMSCAEVHRFPLLNGHDLSVWIRQRARSTGAKISDQAIRLLADYIGGNLWVMSNEVEKLALYCQDTEIGEEAVSLLVEHSREHSIFEIVDAVLEGRAATALITLKGLLESGADSSYVIVMLARQLRLVLLMQELLRLRVPRREFGDRLGLNARFVVERVEQHAKLHSSEKVKLMYRRILDTDLDIKRGMDARGDIALETLVAELGGGITLAIGDRSSLPQLGSRLY